MRILIPSARTTEQGHSKFVVYNLLIINNVNSSSSRVKVSLQLKLRLVPIQSCGFKVLTHNNLFFFGYFIELYQKQLERRYRDFHALYKNLRRLYPPLEFRDFPPKKIRHLNEKVTQERRVALQVCDYFMFNYRNIFVYDEQADILMYN